MNTQPRIMRWSVILGIVIVTNLFFGYALSLIYKSPQFENYCPNSQVNLAVTSQAQCLAQGGQWNENVPAVPTLGEKVSQPAGYCNLQYTCQNNFQAAEKSYELKVFVTLVVLGVLLVLGGIFLEGNDVVSSGLSLAGLLSFIIASFRYWSFASDYIHLGILAVALAALIWVAYKKFRNTSSSV